MIKLYEHLQTTQVAMCCLGTMLWRWALQTCYMLWCKTAKYNERFGNRKVTKSIAVLF